MSLTPPTTLERMRPIIGWAARGLLCAIALGAVWSMVVANFIPSKLSEHIALASGLLFGLVGGLLAANFNRLSGEAAAAKAAAKTPFLNQPPIPRFCVVSIVWALASFASFEIAVAEAFTNATGVSGERTVTVSGWSYGGRNQCIHFRVNELPGLFHSPLCATYSAVTMIPRGTVLIVDGKVSPLGIEVRDWRSSSSIH